MTTTHAALTTNSWKSLSGGKWEDTTSWTAGDPIIFNAANVITNGFGLSQSNKTVTIDAISAGLVATTISNLTLSSSSDGVGGPPNIGTNILLVSDIGSSPGFTVLSSLVISNGGFVTNNFATIFTVTNNSVSVTNFVDQGAATNSPARYYRVRLVP